MPLDPRTPVLVGAGQVTQRITAPTDGAEALDLMVRAVHAAAADAGAPTLLPAVQHIAVPQGMWAYADPGRLVADRIGARTARTVLAEIGVLQQDVIADACTRIATGEIDVALIVGGEAKHRALQAQIAGVDLPEHSPAEPTTPDRVWSAASLGVHDIEILRHAVDPPTSYALIDTAVGHSQGQSPSERLAEIGRLWSGFAAVAAEHPLAWDRSAPTPDAIVDPDSPGNRMIAAPYTKLCCSQWNVDQAVALVLCSAEVATAHGVARDRWVLPHASAVSSHAVPVVQRADLHRCHGAAIAGNAALDLAGITADRLTAVDLYSCFPAAVDVLAHELGLSLTQPARVTVTGGMTFFGGPLNSYVLHALATMVPGLRADPDGFGLSSSVSGFLVKQGFGVWSASPPRQGFRHVDVSDATAAVAGDRPVDDTHTGDATIVSWTVVHAKGRPERVVAICDTREGARTIGTTTDPDMVGLMRDGAWIGEAVPFAIDPTT